MHCGNKIASVAVVPREASMQRAIGNGFRDALPRMRAQQTKVLVFCAIAAIVGVLAAVAPPSLSDKTSGVNAASSVLFAGIYALAVVAQYFVMADAIRAVNPAFRMTFVTFLMTLLIGFAYNIIVEVGLFLLIVPGIWVGVKFSAWLPMQLQGEPDGFTRSWQCTTGRFWETILVNIVAWGFFGVCIWWLLMLGLLAVNALPAAAILVGPAATVAGYYVATVAWLIWSYWAAALRGYPTSDG
jgi:hypothetical protein